MSEAIRHLLELFDALPDPAKGTAVAEILRRNPPAEADISADGLDTIAEELFTGLDAEEVFRAPKP